jgi:HNH endonuclease
MVRKVIDEEIKRFCLCGCGQEVRGLNHQTPRQPVRYKSGHNGRLQPKRENSCRWKGGTTFNKSYRKILQPDHPRADPKGYVFEHILVIEEIIGRYLERPEEVHHINGKRDDNRPENLKLMPNDAMHKKEHLLDMSDRRCCDCGIDKTSRRIWINAGLDSNNNQLWRCAICYWRLYRKMGRDKKK